MNLGHAGMLLVVLAQNLFTQRVNWEDVTGFSSFLVTGAIAGFLAGLVMRDGGMGIIGNVVIGMIGSFIGAFLIKLLGAPNIGGVVISPIGSAFIGAVLLLGFINLIKRA